jgi:hypothetical protein
VTNAPTFVSNQTLHKDLGIKTIKEESIAVYKSFFIRLKNHGKPLIKDSYILSLQEDTRRRI